MSDGTSVHTLSFQVRNNAGDGRRCTTQIKLDSDDTYRDMRGTDEVLPGTDLLLKATTTNKCVPIYSAVASMYSESTQES